jgi:hypothetical protein
MMKKNLLMLSASAGQHGLDGGRSANLHGVEARAVVYGANGRAGSGYASYRKSEATITEPILPLPRLRLTPMGDPTPRPNTATTACRNTVDTVTGRLGLQRRLTEADGHLRPRITGV